MYIITLESNRKAPEGRSGFPGYRLHDAHQHVPQPLVVVSQNKQRGIIESGTASQPHLVQAGEGCSTDDDNSADIIAWHLLVEIENLQQTLNAWV